MPDEVLPADQGSSAPNPSIPSNTSSNNAPDTPSSAPDGQAVDASPSPDTVQPAPAVIAPPMSPDAPMACPNGDADQAPADAGQSSRSNVIVARYGLMQDIGEFGHDLPEAPMPGAKVVIRTERGVEIGTVLASISNEPSWRCISSGKLREYIRNCGPDYPYHRGGRVMRLANPQDIIDDRHLQTSAAEERSYARQQLREMNLPMKLITVEHLLGGERIIFYFSSEARVDFRELVRRLAAEFRTRIEMRQVGARDEARLVADYERCGQRCCCQEYIKDLKPISMRMAKTQKATLDPTKISGRCGRLMCCLRYEDTVYEELRKLLPKKNIFVRTEKLIGKVIDSQIITQLVRLLLPDGQQIMVANEEILERNVTPPAMAPTPVARPRSQHEEKVEPKLLREQWKPAGEAQEAPADAGSPAGTSETGGIGVVAESADEVAGAIGEAESAPVRAAGQDEFASVGVDASDAETDDGGDDSQADGGGESGSPATNQPGQQGGGEGEGRRRRRRRRGRRQGPGGPQQRGPGGPDGVEQPQRQQTQQRPQGQPQGADGGSAPGNAGGGGGTPREGQGGQGRRRRRHRGRRGGGGPGGGGPSPGGSGGGDSGSSGPSSGGSGGSGGAPSGPAT